MDTFNFPVTDILLLDQSNNPIQIFNTTVKEKDVAIEFDRKEIKINRSYTLEEKKLLTKQMITGTFDIFMDLNTLKSLNYENVETKILENHSVVFSNSKTKVSLTLKNCNISMKGKINFKINKLSNISFKAEAQGENNEFYEIKQGGDVLVIDFNYFLQEIIKIKKDINALSKGETTEPPLLSATTTTFKKDQVFKDKNNLYWRAKSDFTKSGGYPGGLPDSKFLPHSVLENGKQIESLRDVEIKDLGDNLGLTTITFDNPISDYNKFYIYICAGSDGRDKKPQPQIFTRTGIARGISKITDTDNDVALISFFKENKIVATKETVGNPHMYRIEAYKF